MGAESLCVRLSVSGAAVSRNCNAYSKTKNPTLFPTIRAASQPTHERNKFYKELGMFSLRKKIEDAVLRAEMLAPTALELEEARRVKQEEEIREQDLWDDLTKSNEILTKLADCAQAVDTLKDLACKAEEAKLITELAEMDAINYGLFKLAYSSSLDVSKLLCKYEMSKLLRGPFDMEGACVKIQAGSGGIHSEVWAEQLMKMYVKWAEKQGYTARVVEKCTAKNGGISSATIEFESKYLYGCLSGERGVHCAIKNYLDGSVHPQATLAAVDVIPLLLEAAPNLLIDEKDLLFSSSSSCGEGQAQIDCAVSIHHNPTGLRVQSFGERSCFANKIKALNRLRAKLLIILREQGISDLRSIRRDAIVDIWHQETRRYVFHPNKLVQDVKTGVQLPDLSSILDGNIQPLVAAHVHLRQAKCMI